MTLKSRGRDTPRSAPKLFFFFILASMSKNLRPRKGAADLQEEMPTNSNLEELIGQEPGRENRQA